MKKIIVILASCFIVSLLTQAGFAKGSSQASHFKPIHCRAKFHGVPFYSVEIGSSGPDGIGPAKCLYQKGQQQAMYTKSTKYLYRYVSGPWRSTIIGTMWCDVHSGGGYDSCLFQKLIK